MQKIFKTIDKYNSINYNAYSFKGLIYLSDPEDDDIEDDLTIAAEVLCNCNGWEVIELKNVTKELETEFEEFLQWLHEEFINNRITDKDKKATENWLIKN